MLINEPLDKIHPEILAIKPPGKAGLIIEIVLGSLFILGILVHDVFGYPRSYELLLLSACALGLSYLVANWWLNKPSERSARMVLVTILFGFTSFVLLFALVFRLLYLPGEYEMRVLGLALLVISSLLDTATSVNKIKVTNARTKYRFIVLAGAIILFTFIDRDKRIRFNYRNYPEFIKYYEAQKDLLPFDEIEKNYFEPNS